MKKSERTKLLLNNDEEGKGLEIVEFLPYEPSNYVWEAGYLCVDQEDIEWFVPESGVGITRKDDSTGLWVNTPYECQELRTESDKMTAALDKAYGYEATDEEIERSFDAYR